MAIKGQPQAERRSCVATVEATLDGRGHRSGHVAGTYWPLWHDCCLTDPWGFRSEDRATGLRTTHWRLTGWVANHGAGGTTCPISTRGRLRRWEWA